MIEFKNRWNRTKNDKCEKDKQRTNDFQFWINLLSELIFCVLAPSYTWISLMPATIFQLNTVLPFADKTNKERKKKKKLNYSNINLLRSFLLFAFEISLHIIFVASFAQSAGKIMSRSVTFRNRYTKCTSMNSMPDSLCTLYISNLSMQ